MSKIYIIFSKEGSSETWLKEANPFQKPEHYSGLGSQRPANAFGYNQFERTAIAEARVIVNPVEGKESYEESELELLYQIRFRNKNNYGQYKSWLKITEDDYNNRIEKGVGLDFYQLRLTWQYTGTEHGKEEEPVKPEFKEIRQRVIDKLYANQSPNRKKLRELSNDNLEMLCMTEAYNLALKDAAEAANNGRAFRESIGNCDSQSILKLMIKYEQK